jgi:hypothetical protein
LGYSDSELANLGGYDLVHYDDLAYVASAHQECMDIHLTVLDFKMMMNPTLIFSIKNWRFRHDSISLPNERRSMAVVTNFIEIGLQKF